MKPYYDSPSEAMHDAIKQVLAHGGRFAPRGKMTLELEGPQTLRIIRPDRFPVWGGSRDIKHVITAAEGLSLVGQTSVPELITERVKAFRPFLNDSVFWGAYGPRAAGDVGNVVELLKRDPDSRQAVITLFDSDRDLGRPSVLDVPCTVFLQFFVRSRPFQESRLHMWAVMRSNDAWLGLPYDLGQFILLQSAIAQALGIGMGTYTHSAGSLHLYERDWEKAEALKAEIDAYKLPMYWGAEDIGTIASRARQLLLGRRLNDETPLEKWLADQLA